MVEIKESEDIKFEHLERNPSDFLEGLEGVSSKKNGSYVIVCKSKQ